MPLAAVEFAGDPFMPEGRSAADILAEGRAWIEKHGTRTSNARREQEKRPAAASVDPRTRLAEQRYRIDRLAEVTERAKRAPLLARLTGQERKTGRAVADHEVGHALVGLLQGLGLRSVSLEVQDNGGIVSVTGGRYRAERGMTAACCVAGEVAGELSGRPLPGWSKGDRLDAAKLTADVEGARREARKLLSRNWLAVERIAEELLRTGWMARDSVMESLFAGRVRS